MLTGMSVNVVDSTCCTTPLSRSSKSAAVSPATGRLPSVTRTLTRTTSTPLRNLGAVGLIHREQPGM